MSAPVGDRSSFFRSALARSASTVALICAAASACAAPAEVTDLPEINVSADGPAPQASASAGPQAGAPKPATGAAEAGYRVENAALGALGDRKILDTPYSIVSIPLDLMVSQQAANIQDVIRYDPSAQIEPRGNMDFGRPQTRGFENSSTQNTRIDGFNSYTIMAYPMEAFQTLEILNGAAGAIYGASSPGEPSISSASARRINLSPPRQSATTATPCSPNTSNSPAMPATPAPSAIASTRCMRTGRAMSRARASSGNCSPEISTCASPTRQKSNSTPTPMRTTRRASRRDSSTAPIPAFPTRKS